MSKSRSVYSWHAGDKPFPLFWFHKKMLKYWKFVWQ